jgi:mRNA-degrading endonuclease RelE of RelBE toxin-antitoxin system
VAWNKKVEAAGKKLDERIAMQRARQLRREAEAGTDPLVDQAIRRKLQQWSMKLGNIYRLATSDRNGIGEHVGGLVSSERLD